MARVADDQRRRRDIVVIGASAGGVEALVRIVRGLEPRFAGAVFIAMHLPEGAVTALPRILEREGSLPVSVASGAARVEPGTITVAPPDHHLILDDAVVRALKGPKVNGQRPAVDVLFHSAARTHGAHVVGVVLSGPVAVALVSATHPQPPWRDAELFEYGNRVPLRASITPSFDSAIRWLLVEPPKHYPASFELASGRVDCFHLVGATDAEVEFARQTDQDALVALLERGGVWPRTDAARASLR